MKTNLLTVLMTIGLMISSFVGAYCQTGLPAPYETSSAFFGGGIGATLSPSYQTMCAGDTAYITIELDGTAPWVVEYTTDGITTYSFTTSDSVYLLPVTPTADAGYTVTNVSDALGCSAPGTGFAIVYVSPSPVLSITSTNVMCYGGASGSATVTATGGVSPYSYIWSNGTSTATANLLIAGSYTVTVIGGGCDETASVTITQPSQLTASTVSGNVSCGGTSNGYVNLTVNGGVVPYTYAWSNGATTQHLPAVAAGSYTVTITDANNCNTNATATVGIDAPLVATITASTNVSCFGGNNGTATATPGGGSAPYAYNWSNGQIMATASGLMAGTYTVTITDVNGCSGSSSVTITAPTLMVATLTSTNISCDGLTLGSAAIAVTGGTSPYTYNWSNGTTATSVSGLIANVYGITVTDANGCSQVNMFSIIAPTIPTADAGTDVTTCEGTTITLTATGGDTYEWSEGSTTASIDVLMLGTTTYFVTATNSYGCADVDSVVITVLPAPVLNFDIPTYTCSGDAPIDLQSYVDLPGAWFVGDFVASNVFYPPTTPTTIAIDAYYTDVLTGCNAHEIDVIVVRPLPYIEFTMSPTVVCVDATPFVIPDGMPVGGWHVVGTDSTSLFDPSVTGAGLIDVHYYFTDSYGCTNGETEVVDVQTPIVVSLTMPDTTLCSNQGDVEIVVTPSTGYVMVDGISSSTTIDPYTLAAGSHTVTYTVPTTGGCGGSDAQNFMVYTAPTVTLTAPDSLSSTGFPVMITVSPAGGVFTVNGITSGLTFDPVYWGINHHTLLYTYTDVTSGCSDDESAIIIVFDGVGVPEVSLLEGIKMYPNPVTTNFNVVVEGKANASEIQILNGLGAVMMTSTLDGTMTIDMSSYASGIYFVRLSDGDGKSITTKITKQ